MPCTTILVGKNASYDGSTLVARNEDSSNGVFEPKRMRVVHPDEQPRVYTSVLSHLTVELPDNPMRYTSVPDVVPGHGIWAEAGFNELNVGMSATETLTTNERVRGADPLVDYVPPRVTRARTAMFRRSRWPGRGGYGDPGAAVRQVCPRWRAYPG